MMRSPCISGLGALGVVFLLVGLSSAPVWSQEQADRESDDARSTQIDALLEDSPDSEPALDDTQNSEFRGTNREDLDLIEGLLEESEDSVDTGFVYDPGGRRDPFRTLLRVPDTVERRLGPRPEGVPGLLVDNLTVTGVWMWPDGPVAQVQSAEDPISFLLRPGTRIFDGEVTSVTWDREEGGKVVFRQVVRDPTSPKPFKEVVMRLNL